jgi:hypothetical protein
MRDRDVERLPYVPCQHSPYRECAIVTIERLYRKASSSAPWEQGIPNGVRLTLLCEGSENGAVCESDNRLGAACGRKVALQIERIFKNRSDHPTNLELQEKVLEVSVELTTVIPEQKPE